MNHKWKKYVCWWCLDYREKKMKPRTRYPRCGRTACPPSRYGPLKSGSTVIWASVSTRWSWRPPRSTTAARRPVARSGLRWKTWCANRSLTKRKSSETRATKSAWIRPANSAGSWAWCCGRCRTCGPCSSFCDCRGSLAKPAWVRAVLGHVLFSTIFT